MPKHVCGTWLEGADIRAGYRWLRLGHLVKRCKATAMKTKRGAWRCPLHGRLSTGPKAPSPVTAYLVRKH
jgi:hypothetical protein